MFAYRFEASDNALIPGERMELPADLAAEARANAAAGRPFLQVLEDGSHRWLNESEMARSALEQHPAAFEPAFAELVAQGRTEERARLADETAEQTEVRRAQFDAEVEQARAEALRAERDRVLAVVKLGAPHMDDATLQAIADGVDPGQYALATLQAQNARARGETH